MSSISWIFRKWWDSPENSFKMEAEKKKNEDAYHLDIIKQESMDVSCIKCQY